jgi:hypothetical protein
LPIDVGNSFNCEHSDKFNDWRVVNLSINVGNSFNCEQFDKSNSSSAINLLIDVGNACNFEHMDKLKCLRVVNVSIDVGSIFRLMHFDKSSTRKLGQWPKLNGISFILASCQCIHHNSHTCRSCKKSSTMFDETWAMSNNLNLGRGTFLKIPKTKFSFPSHDKPCSLEATYHMKNYNIWVNTYNF